MNLSFVRAGADHEDALSCRNRVVRCGFDQGNVWLREMVSASVSRFKHRGDGGSAGMMKRL